MNQSNRSPIIHGMSGVAQTTVIGIVIIFCLQKSPARYIEVFSSVQLSFLLQMNQISYPAVQTKDICIIESE